MIWHFEFRHLRPTVLRGGVDRASSIRQNYNPLLKRIPPPNPSCTPVFQFSEAFFLPTFESCPCRTHETAAADHLRSDSPLNRSATLNPPKLLSYSKVISNDHRCAKKCDAATGLQKSTSNAFRWESIESIQFFPRRPS